MAALTFASRASRVASRRAATASASRRCMSSDAAVTLPQYILNAPATDLSTLDNGLRVASEAGHGATATVGVFIDAGSRYETDANNGTAHFLEHMAFKGTEKRTRQQLEVEIENMGGHLNAYTSREQTVYYAKCFKEDVPQAVEILSDILQNSLLSPDAINAERDVILREMEEVNKMQEEVIFDHLHATAFQNTGLGRTILGPEENIRSLTRDDLEGYVKTHYTAPRMVLAGAGGVEHDQLCELGQKHFGGLKKEPESGFVVPSDPPRFTGSDIRIRQDDMDLCHVAFAVEGGGWTDPDAFPIMIMQTLLGSWDRISGAGTNNASFLSQVVAESELAHSVMSFNTCYKDTGLFGVYAVAEPHSLNDLAYYTLEAMVRLAHKTSDSEVERAKQQLKSTMLMTLDDTSTKAEDIGRQVLTYGRRLTPAEIFARIDAVDATAVKAAANKFIFDQDLAVAGVGNIHDLPDYQWLRRRTFWVRY